MLYIFKQIITTYYVCYYIQRFICTYILQGVCYRASRHGCGGHIPGMGQGYPSCKLISSTVNVLLICYILWLHFMVMQLFLFILI